MVVQRLLILCACFRTYPTGPSRWFGTDAQRGLITLPCDQLSRNQRGPLSVYNRNRMGAKMDRVIDALQQSLIGHNAIALRNGMHFPTGWDPYFRDFMTLADVYRYPGQHYDHHRRQLTLANLN